MELLFEFIKGTMDQSGLDDSLIFGLLIFFFITSLLYRYFLNHNSESSKLEQNTIDESLETYSKVIAKIFMFRSNEITHYDLLLEATMLLPFCSTRLKDLIIEFQVHDSDSISDTCSDSRIDVIIDTVISDYNTLRRRKKSLLFNKFSSSSLDNLEYAYRVSGIHNIVSAGILVFISYLLFLLFLALSAGASKYEGSPELYIYILSVIYALVYCMILLSLLDRLLESRVSKSMRNYLIVGFDLLLPITVLFIANKYYTVITFLIFVVLSVYIGKKMIKPRVLYES